MLIDYKNVNVYQETLEVLRKVNLQIDKGEFVYIIGKVGSGKSSLLKTMYGELDIKEGEASVLGFNLKKMRKKRLPKLRKKLGIIFQDFQLLTDRTVEANLRFVLQATGWKNKHDIRMRIEEVLDMVEMSTKGYKYPNELSGGEQQRISIARAILNNPDIILADEPTGNLDVETGNKICELLHKICEKGSTVVMVTHNIRLLDLYPGRVFQCLDHDFSEITRTTSSVKTPVINEEDEDTEIEDNEEPKGDSKEDITNKTTVVEEPEIADKKNDVKEDEEETLNKVSDENTPEKNEIQEDEESDSFSEDLIDEDEEDSVEVCDEEDENSSLEDKVEKLLK